MSKSTLKRKKIQSKRGRVSSPFSALFKAKIAQLKEENKALRFDYEGRKASEEASVKELNELLTKYQEAGKNLVAQDEVITKLKNEVILQGDRIIQRDSKIEVLKRDKAILQSQLDRTYQGIKLGGGTEFQKTDAYSRVKV